MTLHYIVQKMTVHMHGLLPSPWCDTMQWSSMD